MKITAKEFSGTSKVFDGTLAAAIRGLAIDHARIKVETAGVADLTDNSTGTAAASLADVTIPTAVYDGSSSGAAPTAGFNTAMGKLENAGAVLADAFNNVRVRLGLDLMTWGAGTIATANTIPALDKALTATSGATAIKFTTGAAAMLQAKKNVTKLGVAFNEILTAIGETPLIISLDCEGYDDVDLVDIDTATSSTDGADSISDTVMDAFLDGLADAVASIALKWNAVMFQAGLTDLTDNSGGTAETPLASAGADFTLYTDVATASAPKAGWDAEMAKLENNFADLAARINLLLGRYELDLITDGSTGTANTTLEAIDDTLTAVDGTESNSLDGASANTQKGLIEDNVATLMTEINRLCPYFGVETVTDSFGGTTSTSQALVEIGSSDAGVDNGAADLGITKVEADAFLDRVTDAFATMAAKLNEMTGTEVPTKALSVVAA